MYAPCGFPLPQGYPTLGRAQGRSLRPAGGAGRHKWSHHVAARKDSHSSTRVPTAKILTNPSSISSAWRQLVCVRFYLPLVWRNESGKDPQTKMYFLLKRRRGLSLFVLMVLAAKPTLFSCSWQMRVAGAESCFSWDLGALTCMLLQSKLTQVQPRKPPKPVGNFQSALRIVSPSEGVLEMRASQRRAQKIPGKQGAVVRF